MRFARQSSHRILIWQTNLLRPRMPNSLKAILGATASGASVMALEKIALVKSLCGSEQKCDVNYMEFNAEQKSEGAAIKFIHEWMKG